MKIFVSWSKEPSKTIAEDLKHFFAMTLGNVTAWMSEVDIQKGKRWSDQIASELDDTKVGIIVCTPKNLLEPWIYFEAGALAKTKDSFLHCVCFGIDKHDLKGPLALFQATRFEQEDILDLLRSINEANPMPLKASELEGRFKRTWPAFEKSAAYALTKYSDEKISAAVVVPPDSPNAELSPSPDPASPEEIGKPFDLQEAEVLRLLAVVSKPLRFEEIVKERSLHPARAAHYLERLVDANLVVNLGAGKGDVPSFQITKLGNKIAIRENWI
jgi:hypothetical protein